jgi:hypothetical protein
MRNSVSAQLPVVADPSMGKIEKLIVFFRGTKRKFLLPLPER